jgi:signal peptidase I
MPSSLCGLLATSSASACLAGAAAVGARRLRRKLAVVTVRGLSMQPTLKAGDRLLIRRVRAERLRTGQIVVIDRPDAGGPSAGRPRNWPPAGHDWLIKRLAALPTPDLILVATVPGAEPVVPAGKLVVLGDNLSVSLDSRTLGYIAAERVLGVMIRALPS